MTKYKKIDSDEELFHIQWFALSIFIPAMLFVYWNIWHYFIKPFISTLKQVL